MGNVLPLIPVRSEPSDRGAHDSGTSDPGALVISCDDCVLQHSDHCADCVVSFLCGDDDSEVVLGSDERRALHLLAEAGLAPELRLTRRAG